MNKFEEEILCIRRDIEYCNMKIEETNNEDKKLKWVEMKEEFQKELDKRLGVMNENERLY